MEGVSRVSQCMFGHVVYTEGPLKIDCAERQPSLNMWTEMKICTVAQIHVNYKELDMKIN